MYDMLKERPEVTELTVCFLTVMRIIGGKNDLLTPFPLEKQSVVDAYVPVIKMHFSGIPVISTGRVQRWKIDDILMVFHGID